MPLARMLLPILLAVSMLARPGPALAEAARLKFSLFFDATEGTWTTALKPWVDKINAEGAGVLQIAPFLNGALGRGPAVQAQNVLDGVADLAFILPAFTPGRFPELDVLALPGLFEGFRDGAVVCNRVQMSGRFHDIDGFHLIWGHGNTPYTVHMRGPATSIADLRGRKIRAASAPMAEGLKALGGVPVVISVTEVAEALGRGTVDGALAPVSTMADYGLDRVTRSDFLLPISTACGFVAMSKPRWDALPPAAKALLEQFGDAWIQARYLDGYGKREQAALDKLRADPRRTVTVPSAEQLAAAQAAYAPIYAAWKAASPRNAKLLKLVQDEVARFKRENPGAK